MPKRTYLPPPTLVIRNILSLARLAFVVFPSDLHGDGRGCLLFADSDQHLIHDELYIAVITLYQISTSLSTHVSKPCMS
ncbi:hypothetical protein F4778DRAFT_766523 [Xylariomycetidae sp. FL2044]|nr:hypothetical protein F4778DRAFT_766523 [Xylariomycetidae sp. FL2044]